METQQGVTDMVRVGEGEGAVFVAADKPLNLANHARRIRGLLKQGEAAIQKGSEAYREAGQLLLEVKASLRHGEWLKWFNEEFDHLSLRQAQRYMAIAKLPEDATQASVLAIMGHAEKEREAGQQVEAGTVTEDEDGAGVAAETARTVTRRTQQQASDFLGRPVSDPSVAPLFETLNDLSQRTRAKTATVVVEEIRQQLAEDGGLEARVQDELVRMRDWLNQLIEGVAPLVAVNE